MNVNGIDLSSAEGTEEGLLVPEGTDNVIIDSQDDAKNENAFTHIDTSEEVQEDKLSTLKKENIDLDEMSVAFKVKSEEGEDILSLSEVEQSLTDGGVASKSLVEYIDREHGGIVGDGIALEHYSVRPSKTGYTALLTKVRNNIAKESMDYSKDLSDVLEKSLKLLRKQVRHSAEDLLPLIREESYKLSQNLERYGDGFPKRAMFSTSRLLGTEDKEPETRFEDLFSVMFNKVNKFKPTCELMPDGEDFKSNFSILQNVFATTPIGRVLVECYKNPNRSVAELLSSDKSVQTDHITLETLIEMLKDEDGIERLLHNAIESARHNDGVVITRLDDIKDYNESGSYVSDLKSNVVIMNEVSTSVLLSSRITMLIHTLFTVMSAVNALVVSVYNNYH